MLSGSFKRSVKGIYRGSFKGICRVSFKGIYRGSCKGSSKGSIRVPLRARCQVKGYYNGSIRVWGFRASVVLLWVPLRNP